MILPPQADLSRPSIKSDSWGRYYTADWVGKGLVNSMHVSPPKVILELGSGRGTLATAAGDKWRNAKIITVDVDRTTSCFLDNLSKRKFGIHKHHIQDVLDDDLANQIGLSLGSVDLAVCNPPYVRPRWRASFGRILEEAGLSSALKSIHDAGADLLFIAQNLRLLKQNGKLGLILPDGLITAEKFAGVRRTLLKEHLVEQVLQLPRRVFAGTEAQTYLLVLSKSGGETNFVTLRQIAMDGRLSIPISIPAELAQRRMDYVFHVATQNQYPLPSTQMRMLIRDVALGISRGSISSHQIAKYDWPVFHLNNFVKDNLAVPKRFRLTQRALKALPKNAKIAMPGDILIARIGRNLCEKVALVEFMPCVISDCVFNLRVEAEKRDALLAFLSSQCGRKALEAASHGVGARYLSISDLLDLEFSN